jgi:3-hydroxyacyl-[acyl-carrier-protein] dehydratase
MPGVLIIEALAQTTGILASQTEGETLGDDSLYYLVGVDKARFKRPVGPGETLILEVRLLRVRRQVWAFDATATVDEKVVALAELMCAKRAVKEVHS